MGVTNAVTIDADAVGELTLIGPGAGGEATASAVVADIADIAKGEPDAGTLMVVLCQNGGAAGGQGARARLILTDGPVTPLRDIACRPTASDLDSFTANIRLNNGRVRVPCKPSHADAFRPPHLPRCGACRVVATQVSFFVKRWCAAANLYFTNSGDDDNLYQSNSVAYVGSPGSGVRDQCVLTGCCGRSLDRRLASTSAIACDPNASCVGGTCVCNTNYYGTGLVCQCT